MAKKTNSKKVTTKKVKPAKVKEEKPVVEKMDLVEQNPEPSQELLEEILETAGETVEYKEPEYEPTAEDVEKAIDVMNGDPAVITPAEEKVEAVENNSFHSFGPKKPIANKKKEENPHEITSIVPETIINEAQPEESDNVKPAKVKENKPKINKVRRVINYFWNGQEMDF
jgi:hypothetical protein